MACRLLGVKFQGYERANKQTLQIGTLSSSTNGEGRLQLVWDGGRFVADGERHSIDHRRLICRNRIGPVRRLAALWAARLRLAWLEIMQSCHKCHECHDLFSRDLVVFISLYLARRCSPGMITRILMQQPVADWYRWQSST